MVIGAGGGLVVVVAANSVYPEQRFFQKVLYIPFASFVFQEEFLWQKEG